MKVEQLSAFDKSLGSLCRRIENRFRESRETQQRYQEAWTVLGGKDGRAVEESQIENVLGRALDIAMLDLRRGCSPNKEVLLQLKIAQDLKKPEGREAARGYFRRARMACLLTEYLPEENIPENNRRVLACENAISLINNLK